MCFHYIPFFFYCQSIPLFTWKQQENNRRPVRKTLSVNKLWKSVRKTPFLGSAPGGTAAALWACGTHSVSQKFIAQALKFLGRRGLNRDFLSCPPRKTKKVPAPLGSVLFWCARRDLNPHARNEH